MPAVTYFSPNSGQPYAFTPLQSSSPMTTVNSTTTAVSLANVPSGAENADITNTGSITVLFRDDGIDPTTSVYNNWIQPGYTLPYYGNLTKIRFILASAGSVVLATGYYK